MKGENRRAGDPARHARVQDLFTRARSLEEGALEAFLGGECGRDEELKDEVRALLGRRERAAALDAGVVRLPGGEEEPVPESIGGLPVLRRVGRGSFGTVYLARQFSPSREVAVKVLHNLERLGKVQRDRLRSRFEREAEALGRLKHPGVAQVYEAHTDEDPPYLVMEYVEGVTLTRYVEDEGVDTRKRLELFAKICDAVEHAHHKGVLHRDLKPENILVDHDGQPKVLDFGMARTMESELAVGGGTLSGTLLGTVKYMSPEQAGGRVDEIDTVSDVYTLGVILFELLTGDLPNGLATKSLADALHTIVVAEPTRLGSVEKRYRGDLDTIVARVMEKEKKRRIQSAGVLAVQVRRFLANEPLDIYPPSGWYRLRKFSGRNRVAVGSAAFAAAGFIVAFGMTVAALRRAADDRDQRVLALQISEGERLTAEATSVLGRDPMRALLLALEGARRSPGPQASSAIVGALMEAREEVLLEHSEEANSASFSEDGQRVITVCDDSTVRQWDRRTGRPLHVFRGHGKSVTGAVYGPEGRVLSTSDDGTAKLWDADSGMVLLTLRHDAEVGCPRFRPGGGAVLTGCHDNIVRLWSLETGEEIRRFVGHAKSIRDVNFHPLGHRVVTAAREAAAIVWDVQSGLEITRLEGHTDWINSAQYSPDGRRIMTASHDGTVRMWDAENGEDLGVVTSGIHRVNKAAFGADGKSALVCLWSGEAQVVRLGASVPPVVLRGHGGPIWSGSFGASGEYVVTASQDRTARVWRVGSLPSAAEFLAVNRTIESAAFSADRKWAVGPGEENEAVVWNIRRGQEEVRLYGHAARVRGGAFSVDGAYVVTFAAENDARVWSSGTWAEIAVLGPHVGGVDMAVFSPDGRFVATSDDRCVRVWESNTGRLERILSAEERSTWGPVFLPRSTHLVTVSKDESFLSVWDYTSWEEVARLESNGAVLHRMALSGDGSVGAAATADGSVCVWDMRSFTTRKVMEMAGVDRLRSVAAMDSRGNLCVGITKGRAAVVIDLRSGEMTTAFSGDFSAVYRAWMSPDGERFLAASNETTLWDSVSGKRLWSIAEKGAAVEAGFSSDSEWVGIVCPEGFSAVLPCDPQSGGNRRVGHRQLTDAERERHKVGSR